MRQPSTCIGGCFFRCSNFSFSTVLRSRSMALGWAWTLLGSRENLKPEKCLKKSQNPQRPVHALLGGFWNVTKYFTF